MATLKELFVRDGSTNLTNHQEWPIADEKGETLGIATARLHLDFEARAKFVSFYIPTIPAMVCPEALVLNEVRTILDWTQTRVRLEGGFPGETVNANDLVFTGQIYIYSERPVPTALQEELSSDARRSGHHLTFRSTEYAALKSQLEKPRAFICHDSRDKASIAEPLAIELQRLMCPVWYDEFSLRVGDSLREEIERGLRECEKCILVLSPNFLSNGGWSKREYDSVFTREIVESRKVILPIWSGVDAPAVYEYSPILADRLAVQWSLGVSEVAGRLLRAIDGH